MEQGGMGMKELLAYWRLLCPAKPSDERPFFGEWTFAISEEDSRIREGMTIDLESREYCPISWRDPYAGDSGPVAARAILSLHSDRDQGYFASFGVHPALGLGERAYGKPAKTLGRAIENLLREMDERRGIGKMVSKAAIGWEKENGNG